MIKTLAVGALGLLAWLRVKPRKQLALPTPGATRLVRGQRYVVTARLPVERRRTREPMPRAALR